MPFSFDDRCRVLLLRIFVPCLWLLRSEVLVGLRPIYLAVGIILGTVGYSCPPACAQYMYLDAGGDGSSTSADSVRAPGKTVVDVWLRTDQNRDGSAVHCASGESRALAYSYEFNLEAIGGTLSWGISSPTPHPST